MEQNPKISVGLPVYNGAQFLSHALDSLLMQNYDNFEIIISDNGSTDKTKEMCLSYAMRDGRIRYYRNELNRGPIWNFNHVFELSSGEYFMWAAHDDYWDSHYLQSCLEAMDSHKDVILSGTICRSIDYETGELIVADTGLSTLDLSPFEKFKKYKTIIHSGTYVGGMFYGIYKRDALCKVMPVKNKITVDHLLLAELCFYGDFITIQKPLITKRWGGNSRSIKNIAKVLGITNHFIIMFPYFEREILFQRMIFGTDKLTVTEKCKLSAWSLWKYVRWEAKLKKDLLTPLFSSIIKKTPLFIKRPVKQSMSLLRKVF